MVDNLGRVGFIGRFKPLHLGGARSLDGLCERADKVVIGIGSCNKYDFRSPFTAQESVEMINESLKYHHNNYEFVKVPDFGHIPEFRDGQKWREVVKEEFGELDSFVSGNEYVRNLLEEDYNLVSPGDVIPRKDWIKLRASRVRYEMAIGDEWDKLVPGLVTRYLLYNGLVSRFQEEFGLETIAQYADQSFLNDEGLDQERLNVVGGGK